MCCPNCQIDFDERQNSYDFAESEDNENHYFTLFIQCPHCKTYLALKQTYRLEFVSEEIFIDEEME